MYAGKLFGLCLKYTKNQEDAEDVLQDSFVTIFNKIDQFNHKGSFEGWIKRITINTALQKYRQQANLYVIKEVVEQAEEVSVEQTNYSVDELLTYIQRLPDKYRLVFNLYVLDDFSHKEIATMLEISEGTSKSNLSRARVLLKKMLEKNTIKQENG